MFFMLLLELFGLGILILRLRYFLKRRICLLILLWVIYILTLVFFTAEELKVDLREVLFWPSIFFLFYYLFRKDIQGELLKFFISKIPFLFLILVLIFISSKFLNPVSGSQVSASNVVFYVALMSPFFFLINNERKKIILFFLGYLCVLISLKRSALVFYSVILIMFYYYNYGKISVKNIPKSILVVFISLLFAISGFLFIENQTGNVITERISNISQDNGSGRFEIFDIVLDNFLDNKTFEEKFFGSGHDAVRKEGIVLENGIALSSHNDYLEVLYDYGYIGLFLYVLLIINFFRISLKVKKVNQHIFYCSISALIILVIMSFASHLVIYPSYFAFLVIPWALASAKI